MPFIDESTGEMLCYDLKTGEVKKLVWAPDGSTVLTPQQQAIIEAKRLQEEERREKRDNNAELGRFVLVSTTTAALDLNPATLARLLYLSTYLAYNDLRLKHRGKPIFKENLPKILRLSESTARRFWSEVNPCFLVEDNKGIRFTDSSGFVRGKIKRKKKGKFNHRLYDTGIRELYASISASDHRYLGFMFKLLPFINTEYNLLCWNPEEKELQKIMPLTIAEFCEEIGYDVSHVSTLMATYRNLLFKVEDRQEKICTIARTGTNKEESRICINPQIIYSGSDYQKAELVGEFGEQVQNKSIATGQLITCNS